MRKENQNCEIRNGGTGMTKQKIKDENKTRDIEQRSREKEIPPVWVSDVVAVVLAPPPPGAGLRSKKPYS